MVKCHAGSANKEAAMFPVPNTPVPSIPDFKIEEEHDDGNNDVISIRSGHSASDPMSVSEKMEDSSCDSVEESSDKEDEMLSALGRQEDVAVGSGVLDARCSFYRHVRSGICHTVRGQDQTAAPFPSFDCGRMLNENYEKIEMPFARVVKCSLCFKTKP